MDLYDFYKTIVTGVAQDSALSTWANAQFSKAVNVLAGLPSDDFPDMDDDVPFVLFGEPTRSCSQRQRSITYACGAWMGLSVTGSKSGNPSNLGEPAGVEKILDGMRLVRLAVIAVLPDGVLLDDFEEHADVNAVGTEVHGDMGFIFRQTLTIGMDPME
jgi:hypothetical protein